MANTLRFKRGLASGLPTGVAGEPLFTTDTFDLYIGNGTGNTRFQKYIASGSTTQILRGDGSLYTFPLAISSPSNGQVLKYNGTSWVNDSDSGITGSGSAGQVAYFTGATTQGGSNNLFWDNTNVQLAIGTNTFFSTEKLLVSSNSPVGNTILRISNLGTLTNTQSLVTFTLYTNSGNPTTAALGGNATDTSGNTALLFYTSASGSAAARMQLRSTGNLILQNGGTFTDSGQRLQVIGDTLLRGSGNTSGSTALTVQNSDGTNMFRFQNGGRLLLGSDANGALISAANTNGITDIAGLNMAFITSVTTQNFGVGAFHFTGTTLTSTSGFNTQVSITRQFAPTSGTAAMYYLTIAPVINQTGGASGITRGITIAPTLTSAADWRSIEWSNNSGWGLYGAGTANNYLAGSLGIGSTSLTNYALRIGKAITGNVASVGIGITSTISSDVTSSASLYYSLPSTQATTFTLTELKHFEAGFLTLGSGSTITNQSGFFAGNTLTQATNNYGFYGNIAAATGRWNLYMNGTAANYLNGELLIGSTTNTGEKLQVNGTAKITGATTIGGNLAVDTSTLFVDAASNRVGIGTISATGKLHVVGSLGAFRVLDSGAEIYLSRDGNNDFYANGGTSASLSIGANNYIRFLTGSTLTERARFDTNGNLSVDSGVLYVDAVNNRIGINDVNPDFPLDVNGAAQITGNLTVDTNTLFVDATNNRVGIGTAVPLVTNHVDGVFRVTSAYTTTVLGTDTNRNVLINSSATGVSAVATLAIGNGTAPSSSPGDMFQMYSADITAGNAAPHFRTENGAVIKLYQETTSVGNSIFLQGGGNNVLDDSEFDGYTLRQIVKALRNQGILA